MRLFDITNSYRNLVHSQLEGTDAELVKVYSLGNVTVVYTKAPTHQEILMKNEHRDITNEEIEFVIDTLITPKPEKPEIIKGNHLAEISISNV
ncbi:DUF1827 family protein [Lapidilactobacillus gannanensis]|jgi:hypothetical protein|uniref:DUF1827 family protein n=1 Tax=Lapidilactobacillus gannanensis TaxID=2486002 RepID=A0ABW4BPG4_9LACO|nr:DUF1827 family protein [Lapidilactobacillus gannanensis]MCH4056678.1 DUF1827 family protein [Lactobacillaceae bacterium]